MNALWLKDFKDLAWKDSSSSSCGYLLVSHLDKVGFDLAGKMSLPQWSRVMVDKMALFCRATMVVESPPSGMSFFPPTYWAHSLLYASYPRQGGVFKGHNGATHVMCLSLLDRLGEAELEFCRFQGFGVIMMESIREIMSPFGDDEELLSKSKDWYICIEG